MITKSALRATIEETLKDHEIEDAALTEDLLENLAVDFGGEVYDDDEDEGESEED